MTDDIVTQLRNIANLRGDLGGHVIPLACLNAADEIERLRGILRHVASNNPAWADPDMECRTCNDIIKEFGR